MIAGLSPLQFGLQGVTTTANAMGADQTVTDLAKTAYLGWVLPRTDMSNPIAVTTTEGVGFHDTFRHFFALQSIEVNDGLLWQGQTCITLRAAHYCSSKCQVPVAVPV